MLRLAGNHHASDIWKDEFINLHVGMLQALRYGFKYVMYRHCCIRVLNISLMDTAVNIECSIRIVIVYHFVFLQKQL